MTFLPIVERELRAAARRRGLYWLRLVVVLIALLTGGVIVLVNFGAPPQKLGQAIFQGLAIPCLIFCVLAGRFWTVDCLSEEKREGTLGLLFLTDLKGRDIVLGKLAATSLGAFYTLLAVLPVLALPLLLGGVASGEFWRTVLVLLDTFLFSLAVGMFVSAISWDARRAAAANFALGLWLIAGLPLCAAALTHFVFGLVPSGALVSCPFYAFYLCADARYRAEPDQFWISLAVVHGLTWLLLALAGWMAPRTWQDKPAPAGRGARANWRELWRAWNYGARAKLGPYRKQLLDTNAFCWLAGRARLKPLHVWVFLGLLGLWWTRVSGSIHESWFDETIAVPIAILLNSTLKCWIAVEAGQKLAEDKQAGALELLLTTPLTARDVLRGQFLALRRQFLAPLILVVCVELVLMMAELRHSYAGYQKERTILLLLWPACILMLAADAVAISLAGLRASLTARGPARAALGAVWRVLILPWVVVGAGAVAAGLWAALFSASGDPPGWGFYAGLWFGAGMAADLWFGIAARRQFLLHFRDLATRSFATASSRFDRDPAAAGDTVDATAAARSRPVKSRPRRFSARKRALWAGTALGLLLAGSWFIFRKLNPAFPPPLVVPIAWSNRPLWVSPGQSVHLILPDGSLWRWGTPGLGRVTRPERVGTNSDWLQVSSLPFRAVGLRQDGTIMEWGNLRNPGGLSTRLASEPEPFGPSDDWVSVSVGTGHAVALKKDGTLWAWGGNSRNQLGNGPGPSSGRLVQVGRDSDWVAVKCHWMATMAVKGDGTLWIWGLGLDNGGVSGSPPMMRSFPTPTQFCQETNWAAFGQSLENLWVETRSGEIWQPIFSSANPLAAASATCRLIASNALPGRLVAAFDGEPKLYELRHDGSLWASSYPAGVQSPPTAPKWRRVGKRSDWVSIWGDGSTAVGLTADGTIWSWGLDPSREPSVTFSSRLQDLQGRIQEVFGARPTTARPRPKTPAYQKEPRPMIRLTHPASNPTNGPSPLKSK